MQTGSIVDFYDDPNGFVLKQKVAHADLPEFIKTAQFLDDEKRDKLPDDVFALVMVDQGVGIRKYACQDKGNTALSVIYFLENKDKLPEEAQKTAAANLVTACGWYDLAVPEQLQKLAGIGGAISAAMGASQVKAKVHQGVENHNQMMGKVSDLTGSAIMPKQSDRPEDEEKVGSFQPYVDVTGQGPMPRLEKVASANLILGRFPVDSYGEVEQARHWFEDYGTSLHPDERREYCVKLAARADELGADMPETVKKYAGRGYNDNVEAMVVTRMKMWSEDGPERDMLAGLMSKQAEVEPELFCQALREFDELTGLSQHWDSHIPDPYLSTFGIDKTAGEGWTYEYGGDRVDEPMLKQLGMERHKDICKKFGKDVAEEFLKKPRVVFDSLPLDSKRIIMRLANDPQP